MRLRISKTDGPKKLDFCFSYIIKGAELKRKILREKCKLITFGGSRVVWMHANGRRGFCYFIGHRHVQDKKGALH